LEGILRITGPPGVAIRLVFRDEPLGATFLGPDPARPWYKQINFQLPIEN
jgi:hypothetical protein